MQKENESLENREGPIASMGKYERNQRTTEPEYQMEQISAEAPPKNWDLGERQKLQSQHETLCSAINEASTERKMQRAHGTEKITCMEQIAEH